jgi:hypothetical protein
MAQVREYLPGKHNTLNSNPCTAKNKTNKKTKTLKTRKCKGSRRVTSQDNFEKDKVKRLNTS